MDYAGTASSIEAQLRSRGTPERAAGEKRYLKSDLEHLGVRTADVVAVVRPFLKGMTRAEVLGLADALWSAPVYERRAAAVRVVDAGSAELGTDDLGWIEGKVRAARTWALVDPLATNVVGALLSRDARVERTLAAWAEDADFWIRRTALLAYLRPLKAGYRFEGFARIAEPMLDESEFFIRKAIGWVLREMGRSRPDEVFDWLEPRAHRASGVTIREAVKYLEAAQRERVTERYRESRKRTTSRRSSPSASR